MILHRDKTAAKFGLPCPGVGVAFLSAIASATEEHRDGSAKSRPENCRAGFPNPATSCSRRGLETPPYNNSAPRIPFSTDARSTRAFSLLELLVVIGLIAALSAAFIGGLGGGKTVALQAGQSIIANLVTAARSRAIANGNATRILLNQELPDLSKPARYLRYVVLQEQLTATTWQTVTELYLPDSVYLLTQNPNAALFSTPAQWTTTRATQLQSRAFDAAAVTETVNSTAQEHWSALNFGADGRPVYGAAAPGVPATEPFSLVLTIGRALPPGGAQPFVFDNAENVRGLSLSNYGVPVLINERSSF